MKTVLLTGSTGEIGNAILNKFLEKDFHVIAPARDQMNLADESKIVAFMQSLQIPIDIFVHCAGFNAPKSVDELTHHDIQNTMQINAFSFYDIIHHLLPQFQQRNSGYILGITSIYGSFSRKKRLAYAASKHALNGMIKTLALELGGYNIKVNGVAPGFIDTKMTHKNNTPVTINDLKSRIPLGKLGLPAEIANACYFLCSDDNTYINGEILTIDGGYSAGGFQA